MDMSLRKTRKRLKSSTTHLSRTLSLNDPLRGIRMKHGSLTSTAAQNDIKLKICCAMNQLNDLDSRSVGVSILHSLIEKCPDKLLHLIIEPFSTINSNLSALCRKELCLLIVENGSIMRCNNLSGHFSMSECRMDTPTE